MTIETMKIDAVLTDPANVRRHGARNLETITASLARFGQQKPIVIDQNNICRAGNGTLAAARALGWQEINVVRTTLAGSEATAFAVADNRTSELAEWDTSALADVLAALNTENAELAAAAGFTPEDLAALFTADAPTAPAEFPAVDENIQTDHQCPKCGYLWSGSSAPAESQEGAA